MKKPGFFKTVLRCWKLALQSASPKEAAMLFSGFILALIPSATLLLQRRLFRNTEILSGAEESVFRVAALIIVSLALIEMFSELFSMVSWRLTNRLQGKIRLRLLEDMLFKYGTVRIARLETPEIYEKVRMVSQTLERQLYSAVQGAVSVVLSLVTLVTVLPVVALENIWAALVLAASTVPAYYFIKRHNLNEFYQHQYNAKEDGQQFNMYRCYSVPERLREMQMGLFGGFIRQKWTDLSKSLNRRRLALNNKLVLHTSLASLIRYGGLLLALALVVAKVLSGGADVASFVVVYQSAAQLQETMNGLFSSVSGIFAAGWYLREYDSLLAMEDEPDDDGRPVPVQAEIVAENLSFSYPGSDALVLKNISLTIRPGEKVAIVGENGSGKSTFVSLLCGFYEPNQGKITFNGLDPSKHPGFVRRSARVVVQNFTKFHLTAGENIAIGHPGEATHAEIEAAAQAAHAEEVISGLENGYDTNIGTLKKGMANLSGGQWQKLAYARSLIRQDAACMVLDEQTAALDAIAETRFYKDFAELAGDRTVLMISHRLGATKLCDRILVLDKGELVEQGSHECLMAQNGLYRKMFDSQAALYQEGEAVPAQA